MIDFQRAAKELISIRDILRWATSQFNAAALYYGHGTDNAWDDAVSLILRSLHLPYDCHQAVLDARLTTDEKHVLFELIKARIEKRVPVPYLIHEAWFCGLPFYVDESVLIPRSPIAELIERQFSPWVNSAEVTHMLDLCTGSGCIAIACAAAFPAAQVDAVELDAAALQIAQQNIAKHEMNDQITIYQSDLFNALPAQRYDIIVSNPPYVADLELQTLPEEYQHEPAFALRADDEGLAIALRILREAPKYLKANGILIVEVGNSEQALIERCPDVPFVWLEFERGGQGVFLLTANQVKQHHSAF